MKSSCYRIDDELRLLEVELDDVSEACRRSEETTWLDLQADEADVTEGWLDELGVSELTRMLSSDVFERAALYPLKSELFFSVPVLYGDLASGEVEHVAFLCRDDLLVTLHQKPVPALQRVAGADRADEWLPEKSIAGLVAAQILNLSLETLRLTSDLSDSVIRLEDRMERDPESVEAEEILAKRSELLALEMILSEQLPTAQALAATDKPFFRLGEAKDHMSSAIANLESADRSMDRLEKRVDALRLGVQLHAQANTNRRLAILTVLSAVFMPATLIAGIYGMNFDVMPELHQPYAYPIALGAMVLVALVMYLYFRATGWFD